MTKILLSLHNKINKEKKARKKMTKDGIMENGPMEKRMKGNRMMENGPMEKGMKGNRMMENGSKENGNM